MANSPPRALEASRLVAAELAGVRMFMLNFDDLASSTEGLRHVLESLGFGVIRAGERLPWIW